MNANLSDKPSALGNAECRDCPPHFPGALSGAASVINACARRNPGISPLAVMLSRRDVFVVGNIVGNIVGLVVGNITPIAF